MSEAIDTTVLPFNELKQKAILGYMVGNEKFFKLAHTKIKPTWFLTEPLSKLYGLMVCFFEITGFCPDKRQLQFSKEVQSLDLGKQNRLMALLTECVAQSQHVRLEVLQEELTEWLHAVVLIEAVREVEKDWNINRNVETGFRKLADAVKEVKEIQFDRGTKIDFLDFKSYLQENETERIDALSTGLSILDKCMLEGAVNGGMQRGDTTIILAPQNVGKCYGKGTEIIGFSGRLVRVENIQKGDLLMGPDGKQRRVLSITKGTGPLYKVTPKAGGEAFVCNDAHVLSLKRSCDNKSKKRYIRKDNTAFLGQYCKGKKGDIVNIPINEFIQKSKYYQSRMSLWRTDIEFEEKQLPIEPYILGLWLGDGNSRNAAVTSMDPEITNIRIDWVRNNGDDYSINGIGKGKAKTYSACKKNSGDRVRSNQMLRDLMVLDDKHIPHDYLTSSRAQRLSLLAGIIDTDGYYSGDKSPNIEISQKNKSLAADVSYLARSLGFKVSSKTVIKKDQNGTEGEYIRMIILGKLSSIPMKLKRKRAVDGKKDPLRSGFRIQSIGVGEYYGFQLDNDHLHLLKDFTVSHNSAMLSTIAIHNVLAGKDVFYMTHEGRPDDIRLKFIAGLLGCCVPDIFELGRTADGIKRLENVTKLLDRHLMYVPYNKAGMTVEDVVPIIRSNQEEWMANHENKGFDLLVSDYPQLLTSDLAKRGTLQKRNIDEVVYDNYVQLALEYKFHSLLAIQTNREGGKVNKRMDGENRILQPEDVQESYAPMQRATNVITINRSPAAEAVGLISYGLVKCRNNKKGMVVIAKSNFAHSIAHSETMGGMAYVGTRCIEDKFKALFDVYKNQFIPPEIARQFGM